MQVVELREAPQMGCHFGRLLKDLRDINWESDLVNIVELRKDPPMVGQMLIEMASLGNDK